MRSLFALALAALALLAFAAPALAATMPPELGYPNP